MSLSHNTQHPNIQRSLLPVYEEPGQLTSHWGAVGGRGNAAVHNLLHAPRLGLLEAPLPLPAHSSFMFVVGDGAAAFFC